MSKSVSIVFVCVGNCCRSQMAEGFAKAYGSKDLIVFSAGSHPAGFVSQDAITYMKEKGIDISSHYSKGVDNLPKMKFDYVVTMGCGPKGAPVGGDDCPLVPSKKRLDWKIHDPIGGSPKFFRFVRDSIEKKVKKLLETTTSNLKRARPSLRGVPT